MTQLICNCGNEVARFQDMPEIPFGNFLTICNRCKGVIEESGEEIADYIENGVMKKVTPIEYVDRQSEHDQVQACWT